MRCIALVTSQAYSIANFRGPLILDLVKRGVLVYALAPDYDETTRQQVVKLGARPIEYAISRTALNPFADAAAIVQLFRLFCSLRPDTILCCFLKPVLYGSLAAWFAKVPRCFSMIEGLGFVYGRQDLSPSLRKRVLRAIVSFVLRIALKANKKVFFLNLDDIKELVEKRIVDENKVVWIDGIGLDLYYFCPSVEVKVSSTFIMVCRMLKEKGVYDFVEAAREVRLRYPEARFVLVGATDENPGSVPELQLMEWDREGIIEWTGQVGDVRVELAKANVFVLPSYYMEGLPRSTQEAMAMGLPVITTDWVGCRDTVQDGVSGFLVPIRNPGLLANTMMRFLESPSLGPVMGARGRLIAEDRFDVSAKNREIIATMTKRKILYLITEDWYFLNHRLSLVKAAHRNGYEVVVVTNTERNLCSEFCLPFRVVAFDMKRNSLRLSSTIATVLGLIKIYFSEQPDILHHVAIKPVLLGLVAAKFVHAESSVNSINGFGYAFSSSDLPAILFRGLIRLILKRILTGTKTITVVQNEEDFERLGAMNKSLVPNLRVIRGSGIDTEEFCPSLVRDEPPLVVFAGRMLWAKGVREFVGAAKLLRVRGVGARFVLVGKVDFGAFGAVPERKLIEWSRSGVVEWWGERKDIARIFSRAGVVCLPTTYGEGLPKVLLEAASCGVPIVASDVAGCNSICRDRENGLLVPSGDIEGFANAIEELVRNPDMRIEMGKKGRHIAESEFSVTQVVTETLRLYHEAIGQ